MLEAALRHRFAGFQLDVAFTVPAGITALFGRSGAGKTTVAKAIAGLIRCDQARVRLEGRVLDDGRVPPADASARRSAMSFRSRGFFRI